MSDNKMLPKYILKEMTDKGSPYKLGVMGGTFDPIHYGHLVAAEQVAEKFDLDCVLFIPTGNPVRKREGVMASKGQRLNMVIHATLSNPKFNVSRMEIVREGATYTYDTLAQLKDICPDNVQIYFITGADAILDVVTWKDSNRLMGMAHFVACTRPGYDLIAFQESDAAKKLKEFEVSYLEVSALAISSTALRERLARGESIAYLTPEPVIQYIKKHNIYIQ